MTDLPGMWEESDLINGEADMTDTQEAMREAIYSFDEFLNEPPSNERELTVREYRHLAYPKWTNVVAAVEAATAQSAEKIARLEAENKELRAWKEKMQDGSRLCIENAAAELNNMQLRQALDAIANPNKHLGVWAKYQPRMPDDVVQKKIAEQALAQPISTEALDAYVAKLTKWQPIETAPKDGTDVLIFVEESGEQFVGWYAKGSWCFADTKDCSHVLISPTHWMPPQPAPEKE